MYYYLELNKTLKHNKSYELKCLMKYCYWFDFERFVWLGCISVVAASMGDFSQQQKKIYGDAFKSGWFVD